MRSGVILVNFGEPSEPTTAAVVPFLERIFYANASLESGADEASRRNRSRELAERRAPGLIEEYRLIGRSPMNEQAEGQARALARELEGRGHPLPVYSAFQFTDPLVSEVVAEARADGLDQLFVLPVYPLCGPSTNVAAVEVVHAAVGDLGWPVELRSVTGWHRHPKYLELRADAIWRCVQGTGWSLTDEDTCLVFSAHGTPQKYLSEGSRYVEYVQEFCAEMARRVAPGRYEIGYQNHSNRGIEWTQPDVEDVVQALGRRRVVVDPVSFMHEQSETLAELDHELREVAENAGLEFARVPVPHDDPRFAAVLADLVMSLVPPPGEKSPIPLHACRCQPAPGTFCLNSVPWNGVGI
jgi:ferrochelatase